MKLCFNVEMSCNSNKTKLLYYKMFICSCFIKLHFIDQNIIMNISENVTFWLNINTRLLWITSMFLICFSMWKIQFSTTMNTDCLITPSREKKTCYKSCSIMEILSITTYRIYYSWNKHKHCMEFLCVSVSSRHFKAQKW